MRYVATICLLGAACCPETVEDLSPWGERWQEADVLFRQDARWLGGDGASSIDLGDDRSLWLFGDSFIATTLPVSRSESTLVRNSVAVMTGHDPETATMQFAWRDNGAPSSFFPEEGDHWFRPGDGARAPDGSVLVFLSEQPAVGWRAVRIPNTTGAPSTWTIEPVITRPAPYATDATVACSTVVDDHLVALFVDGEDRDGRLARWPFADVMRGDLSSPAWWTGQRWVEEAQLDSAPMIILPDGASECSLSTDNWGGYIHIQSRGVGATTLALRRSFSITGPYTTPQTILLPPESMVPDALVYGGKGHLHLGRIRRDREDGTFAYYDLMVTFVNSSFAFIDLLQPENAKKLYWPHFVFVQFVFPLC